MKYSFTSRIRYSEIGEDGNLTLPGLINYFQDCSTFQSEAIGEGVAELKKRGCAWVLSAWQIHVNRYPIHRRRSEDHDMGERLQRISGHA